MAKKKSSPKPATQTSQPAPTSEPREIKKRSVSRFRFGAPIDEKTIEELVKTASPLFAGLRKYDKAAFDTAVRNVKELALTQRTKKLTPSEQFRFLLSITLGDSVLPGYSTLDEKLILDIKNLVHAIESYIEEESAKRPLNVLMLASPGAGKSHFIKCVAKRLGSKKVEAITFNMATMQSNDDLVPALDQVRNIKVEDKVPLLFLDEFDSNPQYIPMLLPLLWDGGLNVGQRELKLGKVIIVLAGSDPSLPAAMEHARSMRNDAPVKDYKSPKLVDLFSRINGGVIEIPPFMDPAHGIDRRPDKVCIATNLIKARFGDKVAFVPQSLLHFIAETTFRYGVRSIAHFVDSIPGENPGPILSVEALSKILSAPSVFKGSSLAYHVIHDDQAFGISEQWKTSRELDSIVAINNDRFQYLPPIALEAQPPELVNYLLADIFSDMTQQFSALDESGEPSVAAEAAS